MLIVYIQHANYIEGHHCIDPPSTFLFREKDLFELSSVVLIWGQIEFFEISLSYYEI